MTNTEELSDEAIAAVAAELLERRRTHHQGGPVDAEIKPRSSEEAFAVHRQMVEQSGDAVGGWKCSLPLDEQKLLAAPVFDNTIHHTSPCSLITERSVARIEPEFAFVLGRDLPANAKGYEPAAIDAAVESVHMAFELMWRRYDADTNLDFFEMLTDCLSNQGIYLGPEVDRNRVYDASELAIRISQKNKVARHEGVHPNGKPQLPLHWLIDYMSRRGAGFKKGQVIITGSYAGIVEVDLNIPCEIEYEGIGVTVVEFRSLNEPQS